MPPCRACRLLPLVVLSLSLLPVGAGAVGPPGPAQAPLKDLVLKGHTDDVFGVVFTPDGKCVASSARDGTVRLWDSFTGKELKVFKAPGNDAMYHLAVRPDGKRLAAPGGQAAYVWDVDGGEKPIVTVPNAGDYGIAYSPDGKRCVTAGTNNLTKIWDADKGTVLFTLRGHANLLYDAAWSPDGKLTASCGEDNTVRVWDAARGKEVYVFRTGRLEQPSRFYGLAFTPDGKRLAASGYGDHDIYLFDPRTGRDLVVLKGHTQGVRGLAFSPNGRLLASVSDDTTVRIWDVPGLQEHSVLTGHTGWVNRVAWSPDGKRLVSSSWDHDVRIWVVP